MAETAVQCLLSVSQTIRTVSASGGRGWGRRRGRGGGTGLTACRRGPGRRRNLCGDLNLDCDWRLLPGRGARRGRRGPVVPP